MTNETVDKLVVDLELSAKDFKKESVDAEQSYDDLSKKLDQTSKKIKLKSKKTKKDLSSVTEEVKDTGKAFESSGKSSQKFFSPLTKGTLAFAAAAFTLKSIADGLANVAQRLADVNTLSKETGVGRDVLMARTNTEEYFNIKKGTFANAAQQAAAEKGRWQSGQGISKEYQSALTRLGVAWNPNDINAMLEQAIKNANEKYPDIATRNQALDPLHLYGYGTNNFNEVQSKFNENRDIERRRSGNYEEADKYRKEYIDAMQDLSRSFEDFATAVMPLIGLLTKIISPAARGASHALKSVINPIDTWKKDFKEAKEWADKNNPRKNISNHIDFDVNSLSSPSTNNINNQTNNITNNVKITTNDPGKVIQNLSAKGLQQKNLTSNYMSSR